MTATETETTAVEPGVYDDMTAEEYHADKTSLSSSGARKLLPPSCPALFRYEQDHPQLAKKTFDFGHAAHKVVLGEGPELVVVERPKWDTIEVKAEVAEIRAAGNVPLKKHEYEQVQAMAKVLREHPIAGPLFEPGTGTAEQSLFWRDHQTGIMRRARPDWVKTTGPITVCVDYKSCVNAAPKAVSKAIEDYGYHQQDPYYMDGLHALDLADEHARFIFVFQQKTAPYLITVFELPDQDRLTGEAKNRVAIETYARCTETDQWPDWHGPITEVPYLGLPMWASIREAEEYLS